jgi:copper chaperone NosL
MTKFSRVLLALAASLTLFSLSVPLWSIRLTAPQYPEGLGMKIHARTVQGAKEHDLENINNLNHYIGMKAIEPGDIAELRVIPWIIVGLTVTGLIVAVIGNRKAAMGWLAMFGASGLVGLWDFWRWERDYGTNLDLERAIIKIPDMTYQPPLIGTKQIANFTATSLPDVGSLVLGAAFALGVAAVFLAVRRETEPPKTAERTRQTDKYYSHIAKFT